MCGEQPTITALRITRRATWPAFLNGLPRQLADELKQGGEDRLLAGRRARGRTNGTPVACPALSQVHAGDAAAAVDEIPAPVRRCSSARSAAAAWLRAAISPRPVIACHQTAGGINEWSTIFGAPHAAHDLITSTASGPPLHERRQVATDAAEARLQALTLLDPATDRTTRPARSRRHCVIRIIECGTRRDVRRRALPARTRNGHCSPPGLAFWQPCEAGPHCLAKAPSQPPCWPRCDGIGFWLFGMRYRQHEPVWGATTDTAVDLRSTCAMGLVNTGAVAPSSS